MTFMSNCKTIFVGFGILDDPMFVIYPFGFGQPHRVAPTHCNSQPYNTKTPAPKNAGVFYMHFI